jgi:D-alanine transaminase
MNNQNIVYLNGQWLPANEAKVSAFDRGFIFGDGVYEVIPVYGKRPFRLKQHLERLKRSCDAIRLTNPCKDTDWKAIIEKLISESDAQDQMVYLQITRGVAPRDHAFPENVEPTCFAYGKALNFPDEKTQSQGVSAITTQDIRWLRCDIKAVALLANVILRQSAVENGAAEAILLRDESLTEGAASNIFIVKYDCIITPPKSELILPGITRDLVVELAHANNLCIEERAVSVEELMTADEVWMTSSTKEILPIVNINNNPVGNGKPGSMHKRVLAIYQDYIDRFRKGEVN